MGDAKLLCLFQDRDSDLTTAIGAPAQCRHFLRAEAARDRTVDGRDGPPSGDARPRNGIALFDRAGHASREITHAQGPDMPRGRSPPRLRSGFPEPAILPGDRKLPVQQGPEGDAVMVDEAHDSIVIRGIVAWLCHGADVRLQACPVASPPVRPSRRNSTTA